VSLYALDSNILLYAELEPDSDKGQRAAQLIGDIAGRGVLAAQVLGEFLNVVRRRRPASFGEARRQADVYREVFALVPTDAALLAAAARFAERYKLQFWDSVIWQASAHGGAAVLFSEDLQDGFEVDGMRAINPFPLEAADLASLLTRS
jgi:predicted nucleic acid-binding protein